MTAPSGVGVRQRVLRGYGPAFMLAILLLGTAIFVPSKPDRGSRDVAAIGTDGGDINGVGTGANGATATTIAGAGGGAAGSALALGAGGARCADRALQIPGDPYSPPCIAFSGNNGGATSRGVTRTEIHIAVRGSENSSVDAALAELVGTEIADTPEDVKRTALTLADYFSTRFQLYGRKIVFDYFVGQGDLAAELQGKGRDAAEVDATRVAEELRSFAELSAFSEPYGDALARRKVIAFGAPVLSREWFTNRRPYAWSVLPDCSGLTEDAAEFILKRLARGTADFAAGELKGKPRVITALAPDNAEYQQCLRAAERLLARGGYKLDVAPIAYQLDITTMSNQAANIIPRLQRDGVTTLLCGCDPIFPIFLSGIANRDGYYPEFVSGYEQDFIGQLWDPTFVKQAFGISPLGGNVSQRPDSTLGYAAYKTMRNDEPAHSVDAIYYQLYLLALGLQLAGPDLTPVTFEKGMFSYGDHLGPAGLWGFGPQDYTPMDDYHEMYWDPDAISTFNGKRGAWVDPEPGRRYRHAGDEMEPGPPKIPRR